jgi:hypothetical protein
MECKKINGMNNIKLTVAEAWNHAFGRPDSPVSTSKTCDLKNGNYSRTLLLQYNPISQIHTSM